MIYYFKRNEKIDIYKQVEYKNLKDLNLDYLHSREKIIYHKESQEVELMDYCGYIGNTLFIPAKLKNILSASTEQEYNILFSRFFEFILKHLSEDLLFYISPTEFKVEEYGDNNNPIFQLETLLREKNNIEIAINHILVNPYTILDKKIVEKTFDEINYIDNYTIDDIISNPQNWYQGDYNKPIKVNQYETFESVNSLENRFIKYFLIDLISTLDKLLKFTTNLHSSFYKILDLKKQIRNFFVSFPFDEVDEMEIFPYNSQVLMKREGYRELFLIYNRLHISYKPSSLQNLTNSLSIKDMSSLWEYYVLVHLIKYFGRIKTLKVQKNLKIKNEDYETMLIEFKNGAKLSYQNVFESYSLIPFRPDFFIEFNNQTFILDAKFRILQDNRTDILKNMHYYKDSLKVDLAIAVSINNQIGGELYLENRNIEKLETFDDIFRSKSDKKHGIGFFDLQLTDII
jgi:predicted component of viral defense system (DUF524 family)